MTLFAVAKKEYLENVRNAWVISISILFLVLVLGVSALASIVANAANQQAGLELTEITGTILAMQGLTGFFLPILALLVGFGTLAGEREGGSLGLLVAQPIRRTDIVLGKALGLWGVLATTILAGIGLGGLVIVSATGADPRGYGILVLFLLGTLAWAAMWISITILVSSFFKRRGTAIGGSIGVWFLFAFLWDLVIFLVVLAITRSLDPEQVATWSTYFGVLNPNSVYDQLLVLLVGDDLGSLVAGGVDAPIRASLYAFATVLWILLPYFGALALFRARDV